MSEHTYSLEPGKEVELKADLERIAGHEEELRLVVEGLPEGARVETLESKKDSKSVSLTLRAEDSIEPWRGPLQLWLENVESRKRTKLTAKLSKASINNGVPQGFTNLLIEDTEHIWLTIPPAREKKSE
jgi:hypothetical protein